MISGYQTEFKDNLETMVEIQFAHPNICFVN